MQEAENKEDEKLLIDALVLTLRVPRREIGAREYFERMEKLVERYREREKDARRIDD